MLYERQGNHAEAEPLYKRNLAIWEKALGANHPDVGTSPNNLAVLYALQSRYADAEALHKRALTIAHVVQAVEAGDEVEVASGIVLGQAYLETGVCGHAMDFDVRLRLFY